MTNSTSLRDPDAILAAWLEEGPNRLPETTRRAIAVGLQSTRQTRRVLDVPWRTNVMHSFARLAVAAAAIIILAGGALYLLSPGNLGVGGPEVTSTPAPSEPPASATPGTGQLVYKWVGTLGPGTYTTSLSWDESLSFTFTVGDGWEARDINVRKAHVSVAFYPIENIATDPCSRALGEPPLSTDDVMTAIGAVVTIDVPAKMTRIGDRDASHLEFTIDPPEACSASTFGLIRLPAQTCPPEVCSGLGDEWYGLEFGAVPHHHRLSVMNVGRRQVAIDAVWTDEATPGELAAQQAVIDSVRLDTKLATPPPSPAG